MAQVVGSPPLYRAMVIDKKKAALSVVELPQGRVSSTVAIPGTPEEITLEPTRSRVLVLEDDYSAREQRGYQSAITILDREELEPLGRIQLRGGIDARWQRAASLDTSDGVRRPIYVGPGAKPRRCAEGCLFSVDGRWLTLNHGGLRNDEEGWFAELVTLELASGMEHGRVVLPPPARSYNHHIVGLDDGTAAFVLLKHGALARSGETAEVGFAQLMDVDARLAPLSVTVRPVGRLWSAVASPDGRYIYALERYVGFLFPAAQIGHSTWEESEEHIAFNSRYFEQEDRRSFGVERGLAGKIAKKLRGKRLRARLEVYGGGQPSNRARELMDNARGGLVREEAIRELTEDLSAVPEYSEVVVEARWDAPALEEFDLEAELVFRLYPGGKNDRVLIISAAERQVERIVDVGRTPKFSHLERFASLGDRVLVFNSAGAEFDVALQETSITVLESSEASSVTIPFEPMRVVPSHDGKALFVIGENAIATLDTATLSTVSVLPLENREKSLPLPYPVGLVLTSDGRRGLAYENERVSVLDFVEQRASPWLVTGRKGAKVARAIVNLGLSMVAGPVSGPHGQAVAFTADGQVAYAANWRSNDVAVLDVETPTVVTHMPGAGLPVMLGAERMAVLGQTSHVVSSASHEMVESLDVTTPFSFMFSPNDEYLVVLSHDALVCIDARSGRVASRVEGFDEAVDFVLVPTQER